MGAYIALVLYMQFGLKKALLSTTVGAEDGLPSFTLLVPFFNEAATVAVLLSSLEKNLESSTSPYQILFIDDYSREEQATAVKELLLQSSLPVSYHKNSLQPGKKNALACGIALAEHPLIIQTDADCALKANFFQNILAPFSEPRVQVVLGLVKMETSQGFWSRFAVLDFLSLQASGIGLAGQDAAIMGNGAALAYRKKVWQIGNVGATWPSGDDVFLIQAQAAKDPFSVVTAPKACALTQAPETVRELLNQRIRWGAKTAAYPSFQAKSVALMVALSNAMLVVSAAASFFISGLWAWSLVFWLLKIFSDYSLLKNFAQSTQQTEALKGYALKAIIYPFYLSVTVLAIVFYGQKISWKGRSIAPRQG